MPLPVVRGATLAAVDDAQLLAELEPTAVQLFERHLGTAKEWFPHELVPWSRGRDFAAGDGWCPEEAPMDEAVRSSLFVNILTEDNLPHYFRTIDDYHRLRKEASDGRRVVVVGGGFIGSELAAALTMNVWFGAEASVSETYKPVTVVVPSPLWVTPNASVPMTGPAARTLDASVVLSAPMRVMVSGWLPVLP